jgi:hypothetical protein
MGEKFHRFAAEFSRSAPRSQRSVATSNLALHRGPDRFAKLDIASEFSFKYNLK